MSKQTKITKSARGEDCTIRIPGYCTFDPAKTVPCHLNGGGWAVKMPDFQLAYGCSVCHDIVDFRKPIKEFTRMEIKLMLLEGVIRTQVKLIEKGLLEVT